MAKDVQVTLAIVRACTLHMNADGSMPLARIKGLWDAVYEAGDTTRAFNFHRFAAIRNMLSDLDLLEWEDATYRFGKACRWRANEKLMGMMEETLGSNSTTFAFAHRCLQHRCRIEAGTTRTGRLATENGLPVRVEDGLGPGTDRSGVGTPLQAGGMRIFDGENMRIRQENGGKTR